MFLIDYIFFFSSNKTSVIKLCKILTMSRTVKFYRKDTASNCHLYMRENLRLVTSWIIDMYDNDCNTDD